MTDSDLIPVLEFSPEEPIGWDNLPEDVRDELLAPEFYHRQHHSRSTSRDGCRGPLCNKKEREYKAIRDAKRALKEGRIIKPLPPEKRRPGDIFRDELLNRIFAWHMLERSDPQRKGVKLDGNRAAASNGAA